MATKKGGKASTKASTKPAAEAQATEEAKEKQINILVKSDNIYDRETTKEDGTNKGFKSCRIPVQIDGKTEFATMAVDSGRVKQATKPIKDEKGEIVRDENGKAKTEPIEGYSNVWLRGENSKVKLNVPDQRDAEGKIVSYKDIETTAGKVKEMNDAAKKAYKQAQNAKDKEIDGVDAPEAEAEDQVEM